MVIYQNGAALPLAVLTVVSCPLCCLSFTPKTAGVSVGTGTLWKCEHFLTLRRGDGFFHLFHHHRPLSKVLPSNLLTSINILVDNRLKFDANAEAISKKGQQHLDSLRKLNIFNIEKFWLCFNNLLFSLLFPSPLLPGTLTYVSMYRSLKERRM